MLHLRNIPVSSYVSVVKSCYYQFKNSTIQHPASVFILFTLYNNYNNNNIKKIINNIDKIFLKNINNYFRIIIIIVKTFCKRLQNIIIYNKIIIFKYKKNNFCYSNNVIITVA